MWTATILIIALSSRFNAFGCDSFRSEAMTLSRMKRSAASQSSKFGKDERFTLLLGGEINQKWNSTWTDKLKKDLLLNYDKFAKPTELGNTVNVSVGITFRHIEMDEERSIMTVHCWLSLYWVDEKLKWNPNDYGGLSEVRLADHEVWQPDIYLYNGNYGSKSDHFGTANCVVTQNGTVIWVPPSTFQVFCDMDLTRWPFDTQDCSIVLGSWTYSAHEIDLHLVANSNELSEVITANSEWKIVRLTRGKKTTTYPCCPEPYVDVTFNVTVQRQSQTYITLLITPVTAIIIMALSVFLIPPVSTDKIILGGATIVINCLFLLYFTQKLPALAGRTPLIVQFYSRTLYLLSFSLVISVIVINLAKNPKFSPLPWRIKTLLTGRLGKCLLINTLTCKNVNKPMPNPSGTGENLPVLLEQENHRTDCSNYESFQQDWISLAVAIDRIAFLIYCFTFAVLAVMYSV